MKSHPHADARMTADLCRHAIDRIGQVLTDTVELMPSDESVLGLYALIYLHCVASLDRGLCETQPLYGKCDNAQRMGILATLAGHALDPNARPPDISDVTPQYVSDSKAATAEIHPFFNVQIVWK